MCRVAVDPEHTFDRQPDAGLLGELALGARATTLQARGGRRGSPSAVIGTLDLTIERTFARMT
jgi:hypothetical protein